MSAFEAAFVLAVLVAMLSLLFVGWKTPEIIVFLALVLVWNAGMVSTDDALSGFNNTGMLAVGALFVVIKGVERSQLADKAARYVFGLRTTFTMGLLRLMVLTCALSAFLNNTPVVALLIPITRDWARTRGFSPSLLLMPLSFSCIFGGLLTIIGTSTNLVVQGLVQTARTNNPHIEIVGFFEPGYVGLPLGIIGMAYLLFAAPRVLSGQGGMFRYVRDKAEELLTEVEVTSSFCHIGQPVALVLARIGLPSEALIKMRRKISKQVLEEIQHQDGMYDTMDHLEGAQVVSGLGDGAHAPSLTSSGMYTYRERFGSLWGTTEEGTNAADGNTALMKADQGLSSIGDDIVLTPVLTANVCDGESQQKELQAPARAHEDARCDSPRVKSTRHVGYTDIYPVSSAEPLQEGDILFLSCAQKIMVEFQGSMVREGLAGLKFLDVDALDLPGQGTEFFELVLSEKNQFVGRPAGQDNALFASYYDCSLVAVRHARSSMASRTTSMHRPHVPSGPNDSKGRSEDSPLRNERISNKQMPRSSGAMRCHRVDTATEEARSMEVAQRTLGSGDVVLALAKENFMQRWKSSSDFFLITRVGSVPEAVKLFDYFSLLVFCIMLLTVLISGIDMVRAAFAAGGVLILGGWVDAKKAVGYVDWALLLLIGSALGLSKAIENSGLADYAGGAIRDSGMSASASLYILYAFTMMCTELITNNAAAALAVPVALSIAQNLEVDSKPFVLTVMLAASSSFITPIGYQTNTMVWGPGGYKFSDFMKLGTPLSLIYLFIGCFIMPYMFPFDR